VAIIKSTRPNPKPDPVIYVAGGGGHNVLDSYLRYMRGGGEQIIRERDYIFYNQRGAQYGTPYLACPRLANLSWDLAGKPISDEDRRQALVNFFLDCHEDLLAEGQQISAYSTYKNAADLNDLRMALGYEKVNLYGMSYGIHLIFYA